MVELVDTLASGASSATNKGSSPFGRTIKILSNVEPKKDKDENIEEKMIKKCC